jgi:hypothetical protein
MAITFIDGAPLVERQGDHLMLTFPSGDEQVRLMVSRNHGLHLMAGLRSEVTGIFSEQQAASVTQFPKRRRK